MNTRKFLFVLSFITCAVHFSASAQRDTIGLPALLSKTAKYMGSRPIEKVYLHFDKPYYAVGDTIWFKAYLTMLKHQPSELSKIVYVEMISSTDSLVQSLKIQVMNGVATGNIPLGQYAVKKGNYRIRAYTAWMRNFEGEYFFNKNITVGNAIDNELSTHVSFTGSEKGDVTKINAQIAYKDETGAPYSNKKVSWKIDTDNDKPLKGKGTTDNNGILTVSIEGSKALALTSRSLQTVLERGDKKPIASTFALKYADPNIDVQFFPEGGELIAGVSTRIGFKAIKGDGLGVNIKGTVVDNDGKATADIKTQNLGMGAFFMNPEDGKSYKANVIFPDGSTHVYDLPRVQQSSINLSVSNIDPDNLSMKISASQTFFAQHRDQKFYVIAQSGGIIYYAAQSVLLNAVYTAAIPKTKFPTGIVQFTLFNDKGDPYSERITFVQRNDFLNLAASTVKNAFLTREKVKLNISAKADNLPAMANLSVAVIDETKVPCDENAETTILTNLLLTSDLKGYIEKPNSYFNHVTPESIANLDILMLTQGYRRFSYRDIVRDKTPQIYFLPEQSIEVTGTLRNQTGMPINKGSISLNIPDRNFTTQTITNADGVFRFSKLLLTDSSKVVLNARNNVNNTNLMIMLDYPRQQGLTKNLDAPSEVLNIDSALHPYLVNSKKQFNTSHTLREVQIKDKPAPKKISHIDFPNLVGLNMLADHDLSADRLKDCNDFLTCVQGMLIGVTFDVDNFYITRDYNQGKKVPMAIYVGGFPVDYNYLNSVNPKQVESIEIFNNDGVSGINRMNNTNGVLVVNMRKPPEGKKVTLAQLKELFPPKYLLTFAPQGYTMDRVFYSPKYVAPRMVQAANDLRSTIYWNPLVYTDKTGNASLEYYNADGKGTYKVVVEGIDADGNIGRYVYRYKVQ
ncbi:carboxypeptidase regulatory-like domain-containing protein [Mucilaginibacter sp. HMF5004]|uniref:carboxypeptidase-like regulatory domain-containing protein n=1 Tax=Mucilaginibacter rivuli TaxID=2857527 RepID=UPI001C5D7A40|nr:carboxypeptidase-like regulatory domain-containing protein [Mucilaginibacter rivuli]MBW4891401.1 carboxypeptidase regulatory-like domain-containing protein [Mucilaginibacter rivuli]